MSLEQDEVSPREAARRRSGSRGGLSTEIELPELVIKGGPRPSLAPALRELWAYRGTVLAFAERDIRVKYKQAVLGLMWAVLQPLALMGIFAVALGRFTKVPGGGAPYAAFVLSTLVAWTFFNTAVSFGANALIDDAALVRKMYFPREVPVLGALLAAGVDLAAGLLLFAIVGPFIGATLSPAWLLAPLIACLLGCLAGGVALALGALNVYYRDFRYALPFILQLWLFATPVVYPLSVIPERWQKPYVAVNPAAGIFDAFRRVLALGQLPDPVLLFIGIASTLVMTTLGYRIFKSLEPNFADVV